jgi:hypothetical protein
MAARNRFPGILILGRVSLSLCLACSAADSVGSSSQLPSINLRSSTEPIPTSMTHDIVLISPSTVCLIDSYQVQVLCGEEGWKDVQVLGAEGRGPGEFQAPADLTRGPEGQVGIVDYRLQRMTIFDSEGRLVKMVQTPPLFRPLTPFTDSLVVGLYETFMDSISTAPIAWISLSADSVVDQKVFRHVSDATRALTFGVAMVNGILGPDGQFVFAVHGYRLARYSPDGQFLGEFTSPDYRPELPSERDVEEYIEGLRWIFNESPDDDRVTQFARRPKAPLVRGAPMAFDEHGRLWIATTSDHEKLSRLDVFAGNRFLGTVEIRDRLLWFDILGSTLTALVERSEVDAEGLYRRAIDWYEIE